MGQLAFAFFASVAFLGQPTLAQQVTQIPQGTVIADRPPPGWTDTLFVSIPSVSEGDIGKISTNVIEYAEMLSLVILAKKERELETGAYRLADIGVGLAVRESENLVVTSGPVSNLPVPAFDLLTRTVLDTAAKSLDEMRLVARRTTLVIYDSPAIFRRGQENVQLTMRSLIWISPQTGQIGQLVWLLDAAGVGFKPAFNECVTFTQPLWNRGRCMSTLANLTLSECRLR